MEATLIRTDRNGTKYFEGDVPCPRCSGYGIYYTGVCNGELVPSHVDNGVCWQCNGSGKVHGKWIERTPEYQAKLDAKRAAKLAKENAEREKEEAERKAQEEAEKARIEAEKAQEEARIKAEKAKSQYVGNIGDRIEVKVTYIKSASWIAHMGWLENTMYIHTFKDADGNCFIWKTQNFCSFECGDSLMLKGTVKNHSEYQDEKQTELTRCKMTALPNQENEN